MTAVIGILNKSGVALAADSAVTISSNNGRKIYNNAYKIFTLSKYHPVSVVIYNSATFVDVPWEILIKEFRKQLKTDSYDTLQKYQDQFINFLQKNIHFISNEVQKITLHSFIDFIFEMIITDVAKENIEEIDKLKTIKAKKETIRSKLIEKISQYRDMYNNKNILIDFKNYKFSEFKSNHHNALEDKYNKYYSEIKLSKKDKEKFFRIIHHFIVSEYFLGQWTGLIFAGFGEKEIYPSCLPMKIGEVFEDKIRYTIDTDNIAIIGKDYNAAIRPFAQRDVIDTILTGIDTALERTIYSSFETFFSKLLSLIKTKIDDQKLITKIDNIDPEKILQEFAEGFNKTKQERHIHPLMNSISTLSKEDLSELAESLIYLTYLKRRMSFSEESVGGPIDVALITKGDGFVWIKRKHYFNKELNQDFIMKYLKEL